MSRLTTLEVDYPETIPYIRQILDNVSEAIVATDLKFNITQWNQAAEAMYGWTSEEALGKSLAQLTLIRYPYDERDDVLAAFQRDGKWEGEITQRAKDGTLLNVNVKAAFIKDKQQKPIGAVAIYLDITGERQAMKAQARLAAIVESSVDAIIERTLDGIILNWNRGAERMYDYSAEEMIGKNISLIFPPSVKDQEAEIQQRLRNGEHIEHYETVRVTNHGQHRDISLSISPIKDATGTVVSTVGIGRDITAQKQLEAAQAHLAAIVASSDDAIIGKTLDGTIISWNPGAERMYGYSEEEALGQSIAIIFPTDIAERELQLLDRLRAGERIDHFHTTRVHKDGWLIDVSLSVVPIKDQAGNIIGAAAIGRDISNEKRVENRLLYQSLLLENVSEAIISTDGDLKILTWNRAAEQMYGWLKEAVTGSTVDEILQTEYIDSSREAVLAGLDAEGVWRGEVIQKHSDGTAIKISSSMRKIIANDGTPMGTVSINRNITEQKQQEQQALAFAIEREKMDMFTNIMSDLSHDLKTPLSSIKTSMYILKKIDDPEKRKQHITMMDEQLDRLIRIVNSLTTLSKLEQGPSETVNWVSLEELIAGAAIQIRALAEGYDLAVSFDLDETSTPILGDRDELIRAIMMLTENAIHYTPEPGTITVRTKVAQQWVEIEIEDTGIGIEAEEIPLIFQRFYRADKARSTKTGGAGLGLPIAKKIIDTHGGTIEVQSTVGRGSTFSIMLPVQGNLE